MKFRIVELASATSNGDEVLLTIDSWNDWFVWQTQFFAIYVDADGTRTELGHVKIGRSGMSDETSTSYEQMQREFTELQEPWFSIGQSEDYYEQLIELGDSFRRQYLRAIRDLAFDTAALQANAAERVVVKSLLRDISQERVRNRLNRLAHGNAALSRYDFSFIFPQEPGFAGTPPRLDFLVNPGSSPPTNVHVIIGQNGAGKSRCFDLMSRAFLGLNARAGGAPGALIRAGRPGTPFLLSWDEFEFAGLVNVSFSPFEDYGPLLPEDGENKFRYAYVGLIRESAKDVELRDTNVRNLASPKSVPALTIKGRPELAEDFLEALEACKLPARRTRWLRAIELLEADPILCDTGVRAMIDAEEPGAKEKTLTWFRALSSGHSIVLLTITRLVALVEERTLVLIDEPESHLHPPLLSAFVRAVSELLTSRNGVAIIATHSPVVLQEVPSSCAWLLGRSGIQASALRPETETFGENVGTLTREVFGLQLMQTGFNRLIREAVLETGSFGMAVEKFGGRLGSEGVALARAMSFVEPEELEDEGN
ncbi:AAA family ATPase [Stenotrophomonas sepilia]